VKFRPVPLGEAEGKILGHNVTGLNGRRAFRKGRKLTAEDMNVLRELGKQAIYVAELDQGDVDENASANRVAIAVGGEGLDLSGPSTGRVNLRATGLGVFRVDEPRLNRINGCEGITLATLPNHSTVRPNQIVATAKVIPFAVPRSAVEEAEGIAAEGGPMIRVDLLEHRKVGLILTTSDATREKIETQFAPLRERIEALGSELERVDHVNQNEETAERELAKSIKAQVSGGMDLIILAGETAIMDREDVAPMAIERAGGSLEVLGAPVDPGNLLMLSYIGELPILGAPGCARSRKVNVVDWVLPRLLVGEHLTRADIASMGHGGLLDDLPERPMPRSSI